MWTPNLAAFDDSPGRQAGQQIPRDPKVDQSDIRNRSLVGRGAPQTKKPSRGRLLPAWLSAWTTSAFAYHLAREGRLARLNLFVMLRQVYLLVIKVRFQRKLAAYAIREFEYCTASKRTAYTRDSASA